MGQEIGDDIAMVITGQIRKRKGEQALFMAKFGGFTLKPVDKITERQLLDDGFVGVYNRSVGYRTIKKHWNEIL